MMTISELMDGILKGDRRAVAKSITLIESLKPEHQEMAQELLSNIMSHTGNSTRIGISGIPGVGKSSFIENFGNLIIEKGFKVAILAIDPTSLVSGGSILGDKTRMETLAAKEESFIRPSPTQTHLGGVARRTREISLILEAAGYQYIVIETVGVGQSETLVSSMVDIFLVLQMPKTGDELQGIKKGILEVADMILVNKADNELKLSALRTKNQLEQAFSFIQRLRPQIPIHLTSTEDKSCYERVWSTILSFVENQKSSGFFIDKRIDQSIAWFESEISYAVLDIVHSNNQFKELMDSYKDQVIQQNIPASVAVRQMLQTFFEIKTR